MHRAFLLKLNVAALAQTFSIQGPLHRFDCFHADFYLKVSCERFGHFHATKLLDDADGLLWNSSEHYNMILTKRVTTVRLTLQIQEI